MSEIQGVKETDLGHDVEKGFLDVQGWETAIGQWLQPFCDTLKQVVLQYRVLQCGSGEMDEDEYDGECRMGGDYSLLKHLDCIGQHLELGDCWHTCTV